MGFGVMYFRVMSLLTLVLFLSASASTESIKLGRRLYEFDSKSLAQMQSLVIKHNVSLDNLIALNFPDALEKDYKTLRSFKLELSRVIYGTGTQTEMNYQVNDSFMVLSYAV